MKLILLSPVNHDGKDYAEGDTLIVKDDAQAKALIDAHIASEAGKLSKAEAKAEAGAIAKAEAEAGEAAAKKATEEQG